MLRTSRAQVAALVRRDSRLTGPELPGGADDEEAARLRDEVSALQKTVATLQAGSPGGVVGGAVGGAVDPPRRRGSGLREWPPRADGDGAGAADGGDSSFEVNRPAEGRSEGKLLAESSVRSPEMDSLRRENSALKTKQAKGERERAHPATPNARARRVGRLRRRARGLVMQLEADVDDAVSASTGRRPSRLARCAGARRRLWRSWWLREAGMMEGPPCRRRRPPWGLRRPSTRRDGRRRRRRARGRGTGGGALGGRRDRRDTAARGVASAAAVWWR